MWLCSIKVVAQFVGVSLPGLFRSERPGFEPYSDQLSSVHYTSYCISSLGYSFYQLSAQVWWRRDKPKRACHLKKQSHPISWVLNHFLHVIRTDFNGHQNHALLFIWCSIQILYQVLYLDTALTVLSGPWERTRSSSVLQHEEDGRWHQIVTVSWFSSKRMIECPSRRSHRLDAWLRLTWPPTWPSGRLAATSLDSMLDSIHSFKPISSYFPLLLCLLLLLQTLALQ